MDVEPVDNYQLHEIGHRARAGRLDALRDALLPHRLLAEHRLQADHRAATALERLPLTLRRAIISMTPPLKYGITSLQTIWTPATVCKSKFKAMLQYIREGTAMCQAVRESQTDGDNLPLWPRHCK